MGKKRILSLILATTYLLLFSGCAKKTDGSILKSSQPESTRDIAALESDATSTAHEIATESENSHTEAKTNSEISSTAKSEGLNESSNLQVPSANRVTNSTQPTSSNGEKYYSTTERIFPEDSYSVATAPYKYAYCQSVESVEDIKTLVNTIDPLTYEGGYYYSLVKLIKENGYIPEIYYDGESLFNEKFRPEKVLTKYPTGAELYNSTDVELHYEKGVSGVGYSVPNIELSKEVTATIDVYYLRKEWLVAAEKEPFLYDAGKKNPAIISAEEALKYKWIKKVIKINGKETVTYISPGNQFMCYVYDGYMMNISLQGEGNYYDIAKKLTIKKVPLQD